MAARTPEDCDRLFGEAVNRGDAAAVAALYESGGVLTLNGGVYTGPAEIRAVLEGMVGAKAHLDMNVTKVIRGGDDVAVLYNDWHMTLTDPDGKQQQSSGKAIEIVRRQADGTWKFVIDDPNARG
mgnify:CR=1 FL=1